MDASAQNTSPSARPREATTTTARLLSRPSKRRASHISNCPAPIEIGVGERIGDVFNHNSPHSDDDTRYVAPESSAYALLALMASVQQAAQRSADERDRSSESKRNRTTPSRTHDVIHSDQTKKRKPTHTVRKEEISTLNDEIAQLEKRLAFLRGQTLAPTALAASSGRDDQVQDPEHPSIPNALLREAIHEQQLSLACARSMVSQFIASDLSLPAHSYIHLTTTPRDRLRTMQAIKPQQLRVARRYLLERSRHLNLTRPHSAVEQYVTESCDTCSVRFALEIFPASVSVRRVFEAATFYTSNLEISFTDGTERLTIREDDGDDVDDPTMSHHRFLTTVTPNLHVEGNLAMFTHFDDDDDFGMVTSTFVDRDDLHPYRPHDRIRQDVTAALLISRENDFVVMRRLHNVRIHCNDRLPLRDDLAKALSEGVSRWGDALVQHARQHCRLDES